MSYTQTPNYALYKPTVNADNDQWGNHLNANADTLDTQLKNVSNTVPAASTTTPVMDSGAGGTGVATTFARGDHYHPTDTTRAPLASPTFTGTVTIPAGAVITGYAPLAAPVFTGDARAVTAAYGDNDTSISTTAFVQSAVAPAANNVGRNLIHNGSFVVAQRGAGPFTNNTNFTADRWRVTKDGGDSNPTTNIVALSDANRTAIGDETARYGLQIAVTGSATAGSDSYFAQGMEGLARTAGKTITLSFWAWASAARKVGFGPWQGFGSGGSPSGVVQVTGQSVSITTTPARYSITLAIPSIAGKVLGTNGDDALIVAMWLSASTDQNTASGSVGVQSGTFTFWGIQCEIGTQATPLDAGGTPQQILAECQRFYCILANISLSAGPPATAAGQQTYNHVTLPVTMRATPTVGVPTVSGSNCSGAGALNQVAQGFDLYITALAAGSYYATLGPIIASADL